MSYIPNLVLLFKDVPYRRPQCDYEEHKKQVHFLKNRGFIRESTSPWAFPVTLADKKDGTKRLCIDYRPLNAITVDDKMPMPRIQDVLDRLSGSKYFTTLDVAWGFWHVAMDEESIPKTAFVTNEGHYELASASLRTQEFTRYFSAVYPENSRRSLIQGCHQ